MNRTRANARKPEGRRLRPQGLGGAQRIDVVPLSNLAASDLITSGVQPVRPLSFLGPFHPKGKK
jgi:hypothetical protein